jgi:hypothetical protein
VTRGAAKVRCCTAVLAPVEPRYGALRTRHDFIVLLACDANALKKGRCLGLSDLAVLVTVEPVSLSANWTGGVVREVDELKVDVMIL